MLQSSEYDTFHYLKWYRQVENFCQVEVRKTLVFTPKTVALMVVGWGILLSFYTVAVMVVMMSKVSFMWDDLLIGETLSIEWAWLRFVLAAGIVIAAPYVLAYILPIPLWFTRIFIQIPTQFFIVRKAKRTLAAHPGFKIAIAGSFGKTSMREILKTVLSEGKKVAAPPHSYNTPLGISKFIQGLKGDEEVLIFEFGEYYPGDVRELAELVQPQLGVIAWVNEAHLEKFKTLDQTVATIFELADFLGDRPLYVNEENTLARNKAPRGSVLYSGEGISWKFGKSEKSDWVQQSWKVENSHTDLKGTTFTLVRGSERLVLKTDLLGLHQIGPITAAVDIADRLGLSAITIQKGVSLTKPFEHRLEPSIDSSGVVTLDDSYNGNPDGVRAVIDYLSSITGHRRWYVTPGLVEMGAQTEVIHREIGKLLAKARIEKVVLLKNSVTSYIEAGLRESKYEGEVIWFEDALTAFAALPQMTVSGDVILLQNDWPDQYR